ncbi:CheR family methyltransferase [Larkinella rosea]|uniref:Protein-glutamate O-methyltransferase CheR n=1 Tax=Larkinella rosea TaxID=2025312 RepID=A0A3P1BAG5_9BACT|nr:protein-glutamate O-methyltransferase CheR [Larkinella rosea]RRA97984.1 protein-glutamate O-methyltransferase CheR [Larkinella rosea]
MTVHSHISTEELEEIILLVRKQYGYDFGDYARASLQRRVIRCMQKAGCLTAYELKYQLTNDSRFFTWFIESLTVNVTEMFRDPAFYKELRNNVLPKLASYPTIKIWHAGCSTGEEVFSMAILLHEVGLLNRARLYATDLNPANLERARQGIVPLQNMKEYTSNYIQSGGIRDFSSYYTARYDNAIIHKEYRKNLVFATHNLATDQVFNEFQLVCCRNVLIYFNRTLQNRVMTLFSNSLSPLGYLALGMKESLLFSEARHQFDVVSPAVRIYRSKT